MFSPAARAHSEATRGDTYASATASFVAGAVHFWNEAPFVRGGYTSPHVTEPSWARAAVQETHCGRVFFAGACIVRPAADVVGTNFVFLTCHAGSQAKHAAVLFRKSAAP